MQTGAGFDSQSQNRLYPQSGVARERERTVACARIHAANIVGCLCPRGELSARKDGGCGGARQGDADLVAHKRARTSPEEASPTTSLRSELLGAVGAGGQCSLCLGRYGLCTGPSTSPRVYSSTLFPCWDDFKPFAVIGRHQPCCIEHGLQQLRTADLAVRRQGSLG